MPIHPTGLSLIVIENSNAALNSSRRVIAALDASYLRVCSETRNFLPQKQRTRCLTFKCLY